MPNAVFAIWYPVVKAAALATMIRRVQAIVTAKLWRFDLEVQGEPGTEGMTATGMLVINPPWVLAQELTSAIDTMGPQLPYQRVSFSARCLKE